MLGTIIGDMIGGAYQNNPTKSKDFDIFPNEMIMSDDSYLTLAVTKTLLKNYPIDYSKCGLKKIKDDVAKGFIETYNRNPFAGFGPNFFKWCRLSVKYREIAPPYFSCGNGAAMRISPVGWIARNEEEAILLSRMITEITHNHPEGIKGAEAVAIAIFLALNGKSIEEIRKRMISYYPEIATFDFEWLVNNYRLSNLCQKSVPQAIFCFLISSSFEDAIRNAVALGGDCDTITSICASIAEAYYQKEKVSPLEKEFLLKIVDNETKTTIFDFHKMIGNRKYES